MKYFEWLRFEVDDSSLYAQLVTRFVEFTVSKLPDRVLALTGRKI
jgi:hypothetical protein